MEDGNHSQHQNKSKKIRWSEHGWQSNLALLYVPPALTTIAYYALSELGTLAHAMG
jgi:hypothetical protein